MQKTVLASACVLAAFAVPRARAQKEAMGMFYQLQMAPRVCNWTNAGDPAKLNATIAAQEKALGISGADRTAMMKAAETDLRADAGNCAPDGLLRPMYDEAIK